MSKNRLKIIKYLVLACSVISLDILPSGCNDNSLENDMSYNEKLVVRSLLEAGRPIEVEVSRTLPLSNSFNQSQAFINNAIVKIKNRGVTRKLDLKSDGRYSFSGLLALNGEKYELTAEWNGKTASAVTSVPFSTTFQKAVLSRTIQGNDTLWFAEGVLIPRKGSVYGATWLILSPLDTLRIEDDVIPLLSRETDKDLKGNLNIKTRNIPGDLIKKYRSNIYIRVHAFDEQFYNFFLTQDANNASTNIFSQSGINLRWNISGEAIGMFIGKTDFIIKVP